MMSQIDDLATSLICDSKENLAIVFDNWKYKHYFELIWSKSKNIVVPYTFSIVSFLPKLFEIIN